MNNHRTDWSSIGWVLQYINESTRLQNVTCGSHLDLFPWYISITICFWIHATWHNNTTGRSNCPDCSPLAQIVVGSVCLLYTSTWHEEQLYSLRSMPNSTWKFPMLDKCRCSFPLQCTESLLHPSYRYCPMLTPNCFNPFKVRSQVRYVVNEYIFE